MGKEDLRQYGIDVDDPALSRAEIVDRLRGLGVPLRPSTVTQLRIGYSSGERITAKLQMVEALKGTGKSKDKLYLRIAKAAQDARTVNKSGRFATTDYALDIAKKLGMDPQSVRRCIRAMRIDIALSEGERNGCVDLGAFNKAAGQFISEYGYGRKQSMPVRALDDQWNGHSVRDFYKSFYGVVTSTQTARTWLPYEVDAFSAFYDSRLLQGSPLSPFDRLTLTKNVEGNSLVELVDDVRTQTGVKHDPTVHFVHTNALLHGRPTSK